MKPKYELKEGTDMRRKGKFHSFTLNSKNLSKEEFYKLEAVLTSYKMYYIPTAFWLELITSNIGFMIFSWSQEMYKEDDREVDFATFLEVLDDCNVLGLTYGKLR